MDIEGKHFPDEEDEYSIKTGKKSKKRFGKIVFRVLAICSALVYILFFIRIFSSCDSTLLEEVTFSDKAVGIYYESPKDFVVYKINTKDFMEYYGTITLSNVMYAQTAGELEIGVKYNTKITDPAKQNVSVENPENIPEFPLVYKLKDQKGNEYPVCNRVNVEKGSYKFERISFSGLKIDFTDNYLNTDKYYASGEGVHFDTEETEGGEKYTLEIYNPVTKETKSFVIYDNNTSYKSVEYEPNR